MTDLTVPEHDFDPDRLPWEKQKKELPKAFGAFAFYRDLGFTRSLTTAAQGLHETMTRGGKVETLRVQLGKWSVKYRWQERCELYDMAVDRRNRELQQTQRDRLLEEIGDAGEILRTLARIRLLGAPGQNGQPPVPGMSLSDMDPGDVARFLDLGVRFGLRALGEPTDYVKGAFLIAPATLTKMVGIVADVALKYIDGSYHEAFLREAAEATGGELPE